MGSATNDSRRVRVSDGHFHGSHLELVGIALSGTVFEATLEGNGLPRERPVRNAGSDSSSSETERCADLVGLSALVAQTPEREPRLTSSDRCRMRSSQGCSERSTVTRSRDRHHPLDTPFGIVPSDVTTSRSPSVLALSPFPGLGLGVDQFEQFVELGG